MGKETKDKKGQKGKKRASSPVPEMAGPAPNMEALRELCDTQVKQFNTVKNTDSSYSGQLLRGKVFLKVLIDERRKKGEAVCKDGIVTDELEKAFDKGGPNRYSATALELFLVHKCYVQGRGVSTAESIHGAFAAYWDSMDEGQYSGVYSLNKKTGEVRGCPARAANVKAVVQSVKMRAKQKGSATTRNHADAMTIEELQQLMQWSLKECPDYLLDEDFPDIATFKFRMEHTMMRAFMSSAFTLWTHCFELLSLQRLDIDEGCHGPAPYYHPHFKVHLTNRKGWQQEKGYDGPRTSNVYEIYHQDIHEINMNFHLMRWKGLLERSLQSNLEDEDFLFPHIAVNGQIHTRRQTSYDTLSGVLTQFCSGAGIDKRYTTHSFWRGGAQYRFMYAPLGQRWTLNRIRWWGGWAIGEHVDTLIKYLVNSLQSFENGHGDALHPTPLEKDVSFMGEHTGHVPATRNDIEQLKSSVSSDFFTLAAAFHAATRESSITAALLPPPPAHDVPILHSEQRPRAKARGSSPFTPYQVPNRCGSADSLNTDGSESSSSSSELSSCDLHSGIYIPDLGRAPGAWRRAVAQWTEVDRTTGLALRDWPAAWYTGSMRTVTGSKRSMRQLVYEEYERLGFCEERFMEVYPEAEKGITNLLVSIRKQNSRTWASKNGTPRQRASSS